MRVPWFLPGFTFRATLVPVDPAWGFWKRAKFPPNSPSPLKYYYDQKVTTVMSPEGHGDRDIHQLTGAGLCCYHVRRPYVASGLGLSLSSRLKTQPPTVIPTPESPQMPHAQDHTHSPPLKTWSSSLGTHVSVTKPVMPSHKLEV